MLSFAGAPERFVVCGIGRGMVSMASGMARTARCGVHSFAGSVRAPNEQIYNQGSE